MKNVFVYLEKDINVLWGYRGKTNQNLQIYALVKASHQRKITAQAALVINKYALGNHVLYKAQQ